MIDEINGITAPAGTTGLATRIDGHIVAVAADWANGDDVVRVFDFAGGVWRESTHRVKVFSDSRDALKFFVLIAKGLTEDEFDQLDGGLDAVEIDEDGDVRVEMAEMLERHGHAFAGPNSLETAQDWLNNGFSVEEADEWCEIGCWDADVADRFRGAGLSPAEVEAVGELFDDLGCLLFLPWLRSLWTNRTPSSLPELPGLT